MGQLIVSVGWNGMALAADGRAVRVHQDGQKEVVAVRRLYPLGTHGVLLVAGGPMAVGRVRRRVEGARGQDVQGLKDVVGAALLEAAQGGEVFRREEEVNGPLIVVLAGWDVGGERDGLSACAVSWSETGLTWEPILDAWMFPRRRVQEARLKRMARRNPSAQEMLQEMRLILHNLTWLRQEVGPPHAYGLLTREGFNGLG
ncbi:hypothetical protein SAMN02746041_00930 [Desulfacinum hydrothermale DSM 13146]|uniref:20S proteasome, alpha and beta subunits n=1 Tax=Desulfacinum hydrothermale DSM 13146 TaxID=1121390 RepID=A0A1W1XA13_9BACT|nr:hypothetical protein [Desulfacinum hydrothermale]SMC20508.1 hypothetical protein SAMN02746041_00930 [Desulfacinum hydrothermale DSM 13146]